MLLAFRAEDQMTAEHSSQDIFKKIRGATFIVTGGAGFLGSHMCGLLLIHGGSVVCVDDLSNGKMVNISHLLSNKKFRFIKGDINDIHFAGRVFSQSKPDYVMHYAAMVGVNRTSREPLGVFRDFEGIRAIALLSRRRKVKKILFTSSSEVYGEPARMPIHEDDRLSSQWPYGLVKILGEEYLKAFSDKYGIPVSIVRFFNVYGPRQDFGESGFVVPIFLSRALAGKSIPVMGDGAQTRDFVYVSDNIRLTLKAFLTDKLNGRPVNIGSGKPIKIMELAQMVKELLPGTRIVRKPFRKHGEIRYRRPDVRFMKRTLGDEPYTSLRDGLQYTLNSMK